MPSSLQLKSLSKVVLRHRKHRRRILAARPIRRINTGLHAAMKARRLPVGGTLYQLVLHRIDRQTMTPVVLRMFTVWAFSDWYLI